MNRAVALSLVLFLFAATFPAAASTIEYLQDPVFQKLDAGDHHPMDDLFGLADQGDVRAQFILGDLYAKGKGGLSKNRKAARRWFETSAENGYFPSFIRLAALAKHDKDPVEAYQWYALAIEHLGYGPAQKYAISARNAVVADYKMTQEQIRQARDAATAWKESIRKKTQAEKRKAEEKIKEERVKKKDTPATRSIVGPVKPKEQKKQPTPPIKENSYNE